MSTAEPSTIYLDALKTAREQSTDSLLEQVDALAFTFADPDPDFPGDVGRFMAEERLKAIRDEFVRRKRLSVSSMPYAEYLQTEHWQALRRKALDAAEHRCQLCYSPQRLEVHHRTYQRLGAELLSDLTVLCSECHGRFHDRVGRSGAGR